MAASRVNYIVIWEGHSQIFGCATEEGALETPPIDDNLTLEDKRVFFITHQPDNRQVSIHEVPHDKVVTAEIKQKKAKTNEQDT